MKGIRKIVLWVIGILVLMIIIVIVVFKMIFPPLLSKEATEKDFIKNQKNIMIVTDFLINSKYSGISINVSEGDNTMFASLNEETLGKDIKIEDKQVTDAIHILVTRKGYGAIEKDGNTIHFQRSTRFTDFSSGVAYSIDGTEPKLQYLTLFEPLPNENWYYYEEDFNLYRERRGDQLNPPD